jgi:hypothetical protein
MILNDIELNEINGGGNKYGILAGIGMLITLIVGIADGYLRPLKCN